jgi:phosphatidylserine/phosphatidylglycerophosphate/cardiolipin synthase-like enzyme
MFVFSDPQLISAVIKARARGVDVRVMLNPTRRSGETENEDSRAATGRGRRVGARQQPGVRPDTREVD